MPGPTVSVGGMLTCPGGVSPMGPIIPLPTSMTMVPVPAGTIMSMIPFVNVPGFAMCKTPTNPAVAAATAAPPPGVLKPVPCTPILAPFIPTAANVLLGGQPALTATDMTTCTIGSMPVKISIPAEFNVQSL